MVETVEPVQNNAEENESSKVSQKRPSRSHNISICSYDTETELPSRCNSLDSILNAKQAKSRKKKSEARREFPKLYSDLEGDYEKPPRILTVNKEKFSEGLSTDQSRHSPTADWVSSIPIKEREAVPPVIPNLQNLFYNSTQMRNEPWWEIELMNVTKLLNTQANLQFYCLDIFRKKLEQSLHSGTIELFMRNQSAVDAMERASNKCSQYVLLRQLKAQNRNRVQRNHDVVLTVVGIARIDSGVPDKNNKYPITFLSLSRFKNSVPEFEQTQGRPIGTLSLQSAKKVLEAIRSTLANNQRIPSFREYFVSVNFKGYHSI